MNTESNKENVSTENLYQKLARIRKPVEVLQKNKKGFNYKYVSDDEILSKITGLMDKYGISLIPRILHGTTEATDYRYTKTKAAKDGTTWEEQNNEVLVQGDLEFVWVNNDNPEEQIVIPWSFIGQQSDASQAFGSGLTYARRYFLLHFFNISTTDDDPDNWRSRQKEAATQEDRETAKAIIDEVHTLVTNYLSTSPEKKPEIMKVVEKYAKNSAGKATTNYYTIQDPVLASKLLEEIKVFVKE